MDSKEQRERLKNIEAEYANYLKTKYFSDKDIYGGKIFEEKTIDGMTIRASSEDVIRSYQDPLGYWNEKYAPRTESSTDSTETTTTTTTNHSKGNHSSKKSA
ncbi:unnamed protein product [Lactuca virosa]|uniref:Uncharacterized protein n=1 Tax=Lactuca virosa TaxID=75947 RepID=A0AAU9MNZ5_9ASTR|nr:unnamed protein product [Lactuca virosa]